MRDVLELSAVRPRRRGRWPAFAPAAAGGAPVLDDGAARLRQYLAAPAEIQEAFDRRLEEQIRGECDADWHFAERADDDPIPPVMRGHIARADQLVRWSGRWALRARASRSPRGGFQPYSRDGDQLLEVDLREAWPLLTGDDVGASGTVRCPAPEHEDSEPSCSVHESYFNCFACGAGGSILDLGALVFAIEPRGRGFHELRRLLIEKLDLEGE